MEELTFVTSVVSKYQEISSLLSEWNQFIRLKTFEEIGVYTPYNTYLNFIYRSPPISEIPKTHLAECQTHLNHIATDKVKQSFRQIQQRCFLEVTGMQNRRITDKKGLFLENIDTLQTTNAPFPIKNFYSASELHKLLDNSSSEEIENTFASTFQGCKGHAIISLAYTSDGENVQIFEGELEGTVVMPKGENGNAWEYPSINNKNMCFFS